MKDGVPPDDVIIQADGARSNGDRLLQAGNDDPATLRRRGLAARGPALPSRILQNSVLPIARLDEEDTRLLLREQDLTLGLWSGSAKRASACHGKMMGKGRMYGGLIRQTAASGRGSPSAGGR